MRKPLTTIELQSPHIRAVIDAVIEVLEVSNGDAQGIVEASQNEVNKMIRQGLTPTEIANKL